MSTTVEVFSKEKLGSIRTPCNKITSILWWKCLFTNSFHKLLRDENLWILLHITFRIRNRTLIYTFNKFKILNELKKKVTQFSCLQLFTIPPLLSTLPFPFSHDFLVEVNNSNRSWIIVVTTKVRRFGLELFGCYCSNAAAALPSCRVPIETLSLRIKRL